MGIAMKLKTPRPLNSNHLVRKGYILRDGYSIVPATLLGSVPRDLRLELGFDSYCSKCYMWGKFSHTVSGCKSNGCITNDEHVIVPDEYVVILKMNRGETP
jgi:hypothetical protein